MVDPGLELGRAAGDADRIRNVGLVNPCNATDLALAVDGREYGERQTDQKDSCNRHLHESGRALQAGVAT